MAEICRLPRGFWAGAEGCCRRPLERVALGSLLILPLATSGCDLLWQPYIATFSIDCADNPQACQPDAACDPLQSSCPAPEPDGGIVDPNLPTTCAQLSQQGNTEDKEYQIYLGGHPSQPYTVYCNNLMTSPAEYLTLNPAPLSNVSRYSAALQVMTEYQRVRFDPATQQVICDDQTFATSKGGALYNTTPVASLPFAVAVACLGASTMGQIDLTGTAFAVPPEALVVSGGSPGATQPTFSQDNQLVSLDAQGKCGHLTAAPNVSLPFNKNSGLRLQLRYIKN